MRAGGSNPPGAISDKPASEKMKRLSGHAERWIDAPAGRCLSLLRDLERWPDWSSTVVSSAGVGRDAEGGASRASLEARLLGLPLIFMAELSEGPGDHVELHRLPHGRDDPERLDLIVELSPQGSGCLATAQLTAEVDVPRLLPLPGAIGDQVAARILADLDAAAAAS
jgi:hypothetical protein